MQPATQRPPGDRRSDAGRLRRRQDFAAVYDRGREFASGPLVIKVRANPDAIPSRFGLAVGKRLGSAVRRNRVRRRVRALLRQIPTESGADVVVIARRGAAEASYDDLTVSLRHLLGRAGLLADAARGGERAESRTTPCP